MNILYVGAFRMPKFDAASQRVLNNAKILRMLGCNVKFISWGGKYCDEDKCEDGRYRTSNFEYIITDELDFKGNVFSKIRKRCERGRETLSILEVIEPKPDLIIMYNASYSLTKKMLVYSSKYNIKLANDITEWYDNNELHFYEILPNYMNMVRVQRKVKNKILISSYLRDYYPESNNILLPPLCDISDNKWRAKKVNMGVEKFDGLTLIYAGNPAKKDCLHTVINAVHNLYAQGENIRLLVLGISKQDYLTKYSNLLLSNALNESVVFLGRVSQDLIPSYYNVADFMVLLREPSRKNMAGFPTKVAESISAGVPVITNNTSDLSKYIHDGVNGFIASGYSYNDIVNLLSNRVLSLDRSKIDEMKSKVVADSGMFDYKAYLSNMKKFLDCLR